MLIKLDFIRIVSSHEHFIMLNIPFATVPLSMTTSHSGGSFNVSYININVSYSNVS